jgi:hypothetical protein
MKFTAYKVKIPHEVRYILLMFFITRITLTVLGVFSRIVLAPFSIMILETIGRKEYKIWIYTEHIWLDIWGHWDTTEYLFLAKNWYTGEGMTTITFFPLYSLLMRLLGKIVGDYYFAGLILSNISLIIAAIFLYKLVRLEFDDKIALNSVKYLFLFPTAFIFSGIFSESLFLALIIMCFYYAKKSNWMAVGILGFFLSLTKSIGVFVALPLLHEYFRVKKYKFKEIKMDIIFLLLIPFGLVIFSAYNYYLTGDFIAFVHAQTAWGRSTSNPIKTLVFGLFSSDIYAFFAVLFTLVFFALLNIYYKKIGFTYWLLGMYSILLPLLATPVGKGNLLLGMPRFIAPIFPFYILFAKLSKNEQTDQTLTIILALVQGFLMVFWSGFLNVLPGHFVL